MFDYGLYADSYIAQLHVCAEDYRTPVFQYVNGPGRPRIGTRPRHLPAQLVRLTYTPTGDRSVLWL